MAQRRCQSLRKAVIALCCPCCKHFGLFGVEPKAAHFWTRADLLAVSKATYVGRQTAPRPLSPCQPRCAEKEVLAHSILASACKLLVCRVSGNLAGARCLLLGRGSEGDAHGSLRSRDFFFHRRSPPGRQPRLLRAGCGAWQREPGAGRMGTRSGFWLRCILERLTQEGSMPTGWHRQLPVALPGLRLPALPAPACWAARGIHWDQQDP